MLMRAIREKECHFIREAYGKNRYGFWQNAWQKRMGKNHTFETYGEAIHFIHEPYGQKRMVWAKMSGPKRMAQKILASFHT